MLKQRENKMTEPFKCVECGQNEVEDEDDLCDECFFEVDEDKDMEDEE
jgi:NMD protein affecting ribosome stability and mRNA decay